MMMHLESEIREVEARIARERDAMALALGDCVESARNAAVAPKSLLTVAAVGYVLGTAAKRRAAPQAKPRSRLGTFLGSVALSVFQARYGSPWSLVQWALSRHRHGAPETSPRP
jgi:hypothetical protein